MGFDFAVSTDGSNASTNDDDNEASPDFESNETADLYLSFGDWKNNLGRMLDALDLEELKIYSDDTLEDAPRLLGEHKDAHPQQLLHMVAALAKSTSGKDQRENDHAIGLRDGKAPEEHFGDDSFSYALFSKDLPTIQWDGLDGGEIQNLEEMGIDPDDLGFDPAFGGPKLVKVNGQRLPIAVEEGSEVMDSLELLQQLPDEPSAYTEDGFRESSDPSVFDGSEETGSTDNGGSSDDSEDIDVTKTLAENPKAVDDFNVDEIKTAVTDIESRRTLRKILQAEEQGEDRSATDRIEQRIRAVEGSDEDDEDDTEAESEASDEDDDESGETVEDIKHLFGLSDLEADAAQFRVESGKADSLMEAAKQVNDL